MRLVLFTIAFAFIMAFTPFVSGCGKKGPPLQPPPKSEPVKSKESLPTAEVTAPEEAATEDITTETSADEEMETDTLPEASPDDDGASYEEGDEDIFPLEMIPKELLRMDETPEDWI